jgi:hypothetical protein
MNKDKEKVKKGETPVWMKWGIAGSVAIQSEKSKMPKPEKPDNKTLESGKESLLEEENMDLHLEIMSLRGEKSKVQNDFDAYKLKTVNERKGKDALISLLLGHKKRKEALELEIEELKSFHSEEIMNLVEECFDLVECNESLSDELGEVKKESLKALVKNQNKSMALSRANEDIKEASADGRLNCLKIDGSSFTSAGVTALFSPLSTKAEMLFGTYEGKSYCGHDKAMWHPAKLPPMLSRGSTAPLKSEVTSPTPFNSPVVNATLPLLHITKTPDSCDNMMADDDKWFTGYAGYAGYEGSGRAKITTKKNKFNCLFPWWVSN